MFWEYLKAIFLGIVEGITEWLPISSTGHMILVDEFIKLRVSEEFLELFYVVIQLGAIIAVPILFFKRLNPFSKEKNEEQKRRTWSLWSKVIVGAIPAGIFGLLLDDIINELFYNYIVVAIMLVVYGIAFILAEIFCEKREAKVKDIESLTYVDALKIGFYQVLSLIPGTSRSGSTMLGGILSNVSRTASAEFSFFMAIPLMVGASGLKILKFILHGFSVSGTEIGILTFGIVVSFIISYFAIDFLMDFVKRHNFKPFGIYRIILGAIIVLYFITKLVINN